MTAATVQAAMRSAFSDATNPVWSVLNREHRRIYAEVQGAALRIDGGNALAAHAMQSVLRLDDRRQNLSQGDPIRDLMLAKIQAVAVQQVEVVLAGLFNPWRPQ